MQIVEDYRTVELVIEPGESEPARRYPHSEVQFQPTKGCVQVSAAGRVILVKVEGPVLTQAGAQHATRTTAWQWEPSDWMPESDRQWPPADAPETALAMVQQVLDVEPELGARRRDRQGDVWERQEHGWVWVAPEPDADFRVVPWGALTRGWGPLQKVEG